MDARTQRRIDRLMESWPRAGRGYRGSVSVIDLYTKAGPLFTPASTLRYLEVMEEAGLVARIAVEPFWQRYGRTSYRTSCRWTMTAAGKAAAKALA